MPPKHGFYLKQMSGGFKTVRKKGASMYLWSETRERNMAKKIQL